MAAQLLQRALDHAFPNQNYTVLSAGTHALAGRDMDHHIATQLSGMGLAYKPFVSRQISESMIADSDLVLALAREHRSRVIELSPSHLRRTYTLTEFAHLVQAAKDEGDATTERTLHNVADWAPRLRSKNSNISPGELDVTDPYRGTDADYGRAATQIKRAVDVLVEGLVRDKRNGNRSEP
jgi:protein-tyrosine phosphatase